MDVDENSTSSDKNKNPAREGTSPQSITTIDSESNDSLNKPRDGGNIELCEEDSRSLSEIVRSESVKSVSSLTDQISADDAAKYELKKLTFDQNGKFMIDFDPEKSQREMRKMNRRINIKEAKRNQFYDDKGILLDTSLDLCDCLEKSCPGCQNPCPKCGSGKCGLDCRCNRKYTIDFIEVEGTETVYNFPTES